MQQYEDQPDDSADDQNHERNDDPDNEQSVPTVPHQRRPGLKENWTPEGARRIPRQPSADDTDH